MEDTSKEKVIFFDGKCGLCNGFIDLILRIDKNKQFVFCPLQSHFAKSKISLEDVEDLTSVVLLLNGKQYRKAEAVLKIFNELGGIWKLAKMGRLLPHRMRNAAYDLVAEHRYKLFGKKETCRLPSDDERSRFKS